MNTKEFTESMILRLYNTLRGAYKDYQKDEMEKQIKDCEEVYESTKTLVLFDMIDYSYEDEMRIKWLAMEQVILRVMCRMNEEYTIDRLYDMYKEEEARVSRW